MQNRPDVLYSVCLYIGIFNRFGAADKKNRLFRRTARHLAVEFFCQLNIWTLENRADEIIQMVLKSSTTGAGECPTLSGPIPPDTSMN